MSNAHKEEARESAMTTPSPSDKNQQRARELVEGRVRAWLGPSFAGEHPAFMKDCEDHLASELDAKDGEIERLRGAMNGNLRSRCKHCRHYRVFPCAQHCGCDCDYEPEDRFPALESLLNEKEKKNG